MIGVPRRELVSRFGFICRRYIQKMPASTVAGAESTSSTHSEQSSVNMNQVEHHGQLAGDWWNVSGFLKALHSMNRLRVPFIRDGLISTKKTDPSVVDTACPLKGIKILDVGCGGGFLSEPLARLGAQVTGIDASSQLINVARAHAQLDDQLGENLKYEIITAEEHVRTHQCHYDAVVASEVIEHVSDQNFFIMKCSELVKPGGSVFITTVNRTTLSWLGGIIAAEYILCIVPKGTHDWNMFISPEELQKLLEKYTCHTKLIHGMFYNPVANLWSWSSSTSLSYALHAVKSPN